MLAQGDPAHIVNTASVAGLLPAARSAVYTTSKFGVVALSECLALDLQEVGAPIGVSVLCPGWVRSAIIDAGRNRPESLPGAAPSSAADTELEARMRAGIEAGMDPAAVARETISAARSGRFWIFTHDAYREALRRHLDDVVEGRHPATESTGRT